MSFHLHIFNLREDVTTHDIRGLFAGMCIGQDGVTIIGGPKGEAFVTFESEIDLLQAMKLDGEQHLTFKIATDLDKLKAINMMCLAKLEAMKGTNSKPGGQESRNLGQPIGHSQSSDTFDSGVFSAKRRRTDGDTHVSVNKNTHDQSQAAQPPWLLSRQERNLGSSLSPNVTASVSAPAPTTALNPIQEPPSYPGNALQKQFAPQNTLGYAFNYPMPVNPVPGMPNFHQSVPGSNFFPNSIPPYNPIHEGTNYVYNTPAMYYPSPGTPFAPPGRPCHNYPAPSFQPGGTFDPPSTPVSQPLAPSASKGTLLNTLLPQDPLSRFCIQVCDLEPHITASAVWAWVGGSKGKSRGVILLKTTNSQPVAFMIFDNEFDRDHALKTSRRVVVGINKADTCRSITNFINDWTLWKGPIKLPSPIYETTPSGSDSYVLHKRFYEFAENASKIPVTLPQTSQIKQLPTLKKVIKQLATFKKTETFQKTETKPDIKVFLLIYKLKRNITATEVLSWFSDGVNAIKLEFLEKRGPKESEAMVFVLFDNEEAYKNAKLGLTGKDLLTTKHSFHHSYQMIGNFGDKCIVSETTTSGGDRIISSEERKQPPYVFQLPPSTKFSLDRLAMLKCLYLQGMSPSVKVKCLWGCYPKATGIILMAKKERKESKFIVDEAIVAFETIADLLEEGNKSKAGMRCRFETRIDYEEAVALLLRRSSEMKISAVNEPIRSITAEEAKLLVSCKKGRVIGAAKDDTNVAKSQVTQEDASFLHHLKKDDSIEDEHEYLIMYNLSPKITACQLHAFFPDALCALTVRYKDGNTGPFSSKAFGYLLLTDTDSFNSAKLLFTNCIADWRTPDSPKKVIRDTKKKTVKRLIAFACSNATVSESSPSGVDRVLSMDDLVLDSTNPPLSFVHEPPCLHFIQLAGSNNHMSAGALWNFFGGNDGDVKGIVLLLKKPVLKECIVFMAFSNLEASQKVIDANKNQFAAWKSFWKVTEREALNFLKRRGDDYVIKISTDAGPDRDLNSAEKDLLSCSRKMDPITKDAGQSVKKPSIDTTSGKQNKSRASDEHMEEKPNKEQSPQLTEAIVGSTSVDVKSTSTLRNIKSVSVDVKSTSTLTNIKSASVDVKSTSTLTNFKQGFYIRLKRVPADVTTASGLLSLFAVEGSPGKRATLVRDCDGACVSGYVVFDELEERDSALLKHQFTVRCTPQGRAVRLAELEPDDEILESTETGQDRIMSAEERNRLQEKFNR